MDLNNEEVEPRTTSKKLNVLGNFCADTSLPLNMTCKKDSGYGSQGQIKLEFMGTLVIFAKCLFFTFQRLLSVRQSKLVIVNFFVTLTLFAISRLFTKFIQEPL